MGARSALLSFPSPPDGSVGHLIGGKLPDLALASTAGGTAGLRHLGEPLGVIFVYPMTGRPGAPPIAGWELIPGAPGCTAEACDFRNHHPAFQVSGADVYGLSSQGPNYQREAAQRLQLPYPLLSDARLDLADMLGLPTFEVQGLRLYRRLTLVVAHGVIRHVFFPVEHPDRHGQEVLAWLGSGAQRT